MKTKIKFPAKPSFPLLIRVKMADESIITLLAHDCDNAVILDGPDMGKVWGKIDLKQDMYKIPLAGSSITLTQE